MSSENYRYYCLDSVGRLHEAAWFRAASDDDAVAQIEKKNVDAMFEIWQGRRMVARISPTALQA